MSTLRSVSSRFVSTKRKQVDSIPAESPSPAFWRRVAAGLIDRLVPLPFIAFIFPEWTVMVFIYHLFCDSAPERRSVGKWVCRLRVVDAESNSKSSQFQTIARRVGVAATQTAWCLWTLLPYVLIYELVSVISVLLSKKGQRLEDLGLGTRVVTEGVYRRSQREDERSDY